MFDEAVLKISGSHADSGGDLAVSCAPPCIHDEEGCAAWQGWLGKVRRQTDFEGIVSACEGVSTSTFKTDAEDRKMASYLDLVDVEQGQLEDLSVMRARPHLLPYRRYLYVGEVSLPRAERERLGATVSPLSRLSSVANSERSSLLRRTISQPLSAVWCDSKSGSKMLGEAKMLLFILPPVITSFISNTHQGRQESNASRDVVTHIHSS